MLDALLLLAQMLQDMLVCARCKHCTATVCKAWCRRYQWLPDNEKAITSVHVHHFLFVVRAQAASDNVHSRLCRMTQARPPVHTKQIQC
jgi:hypothetical protein